MRGTPPETKSALDAFLAAAIISKDLVYRHNLLNKLYNQLYQLSKQGKLSNNDAVLISKLSDYKEPFNFLNAIKQSTIDKTNTIFNEVKQSIEQRIKAGNASEFSSTAIYKKMGAIPQKLPEADADPKTDPRAAAVFLTKKPKNQDEYLLYAQVVHEWRQDPTVVAIARDKNNISNLVYACSKMQKQQL